MTNLEWIKKVIAEMSAEELRDWKYSESPWCQDDCIAECQKCAKSWLEAKHQDPMPTLKNGMFVEWDGYLLGVVVDNFIVFYDGTFASDVSEASKYITKVFANVICFNECYTTEPIWRKDWRKD